MRLTLNASLFYSSPETVILTYLNLSPPLNVFRIVSSRNHTATVHVNDQFIKASMLQTYRIDRFELECLTYGGAGTCIKKHV